MSIQNEEVWKEVKAGTYLGLSIEGNFSDEQKLSAIKEQELIEKIKQIIINQRITNSTNCCKFRNVICSP